MMNEGIGSSVGDAVGDIVSSIWKISVLARTWKAFHADSFQAIEVTTRIVQSRILMAQMVPSFDDMRLRTVAAILVRRSLPWDSSSCAVETSIGLVILLPGVLDSSMSDNTSASCCSLIMLCNLALKFFRLLPISTGGLVCVAAPKNPNGHIMSATDHITNFLG